MTLATTIALRTVMESVMDEVFKKDQRSNERYDPTKCLRVMRCFSGEQGASDRIERVKESERGAAYPRIAARGRYKRDGDEDTAVAREHEGIEQDKREERQGRHKYSVCGSRGLLQMSRKKHPSTGCFRP